MTSKEASQILLQLSEIPFDALRLSQQACLKKCTVEERRVLIEQLQLRKRAVNKFSRSSEMLFLPSALEMASGERISRYKAKRLPAGRVLDLCCGLGGDSLFNKAEKIFGVDLDWNSLQAFRHNHLLYGNRVEAVQGDVTRICNATRSVKQIDIVLIDPSRRAFQNTKARKWTWDELSPGPLEIQKLLREYPNLVIKLGPGLEIPPWLWNSEIEYIGQDDQCLQAVVWSGKLGEASLVRATELKGNGKTQEEHSIFASREEIQSISLPQSEPLEYIYEPVKCVIRSHLIGPLAKALKLCQLDSQVAFLSGAWCQHPLLKAYRVLEHFPWNMAQIHASLKQREIGILEIKKRALAWEPDEIRKKLKLKGRHSATLIGTRVADQPWAILAERIQTEKI